MVPLRQLRLGCGAVAVKACGVASNVILARLLVPEELGVMVAILAIAGLFGVPAEVGTRYWSQSGLKRFCLN